MRADIQPTAPKPVHLNVEEAVTPSMDPVYMGVLILALSLSTASVRNNQQEGFSQNTAIIQS